MNKVLNAPGAACKHNISQGHHNRNDTLSTTSIDCKLDTRKDESVSSNTVKNGDVAEIMGDTLNMIEGFINDMVLETSHMEAPTMVEDNNKTNTVSKFGKAKPVVVHENNNDALKLADTGLKANNTLGAHVVEEKEGWFYDWADNHNV